MVAKKHTKQITVRFYLVATEPTGGIPKKINWQKRLKNIADVSKTDLPDGRMLIGSPERSPAEQALSLSIDRFQSPRCYVP